MAKDLAAEGVDTSGSTWIATKPRGRRASTQKVLPRAGIESCLFLRLLAAKNGERWW